MSEGPGASTAGSATGGPSTPRPSARCRQIVLPAAIAGLAIAAGLGALRFALSEPPERSAEWLGDVALGAIYATPAVLALLGLRSRPSLIAAAGLLGLALAFTAFSGVALVLVIPSVLYLVGYARASARSSRPRLPVVLVVLVPLALGIGALFVLFAHDDPICWAIQTTPAGKVYTVIPVSGQSSNGFYFPLPAGATESGCSSDTISTREALASFGLVLAALVAGAVAATPRSNRTTALAYEGGGGTGPTS